MQIIHLCSHTKSNCQFVFLFLTLKVICLQIIYNELFILLPQEAIGSSREPLRLQSSLKNSHFSSNNYTAAKRLLTEWGTAQQALQWFPRSLPWVHHKTKTRPDPPRPPLGLKVRFWAGFEDVVDSWLLSRKSLVSSNRLAGTGFWPQWRRIWAL